MIYSPAVTAEMMGLQPVHEKRYYAAKEVEINRQFKNKMGFDIAAMLPSPSIMQALGVFLPKAYALTKQEKMDASLVPKESKIRHLFEVDSSSTTASSSTGGRRAHVSLDIETPVGNIKVSGIATSFSS